MNFFVPDLEVEITKLYGIRSGIYCDMKFMVTFHAATRESVLECRRMCDHKDRWTRSSRTKNIQ
jgi:hypothetical protein